MSLALVFYAAVASLGLLCSTASAYSWQFTNTVQQCQNLSLSLSGSGQPPYSVLVVPYGHLNPEVRSIINTPFTETSVTFPIDYPANSQFVAVVSVPSRYVLCDGVSYQLLLALGLGVDAAGEQMQVPQNRNSECVVSWKPCAVTVLHYRVSSPPRVKVKLLLCILRGQSFAGSLPSVPPVNARIVVPRVSFVK